MKSRIYRTATGELVKVQHTDTGLTITYPDGKVVVVGTTKLR